VRGGHSAGVPRLTEADGAAPTRQSSPVARRGLQKERREGKIGLPDRSFPALPDTGAALGRPSAFQGSGLQRILHVCRLRVRQLNVSHELTARLLPFMARPPIRPGGVVRLSLRQRLPRPLYRSLDAAQHLLMLRIGRCRSVRRLHQPLPTRGQTCRLLSQDSRLLSRPEPRMATITLPCQHCASRAPRNR
jgi:hypothetical protein